MPIYNWFKIHQTGNYTYLRKEPSKAFEYNKELEIIWYSMYDSFLLKFGITDDFKRLLRLKKKRINELCNYILGDSFALTEAEFTGADMQEIMSATPNVSDEETLIMIEEALGFKINPKVVSVVEYYNYLNYIGKKK